MQLGVNGLGVRVLRVFKKTVLGVFGKEFAACDRILRCNYSAPENFRA